MRFITDVMLGRLSRWLRLLGFDTKSGIVEDDDILKVAEGESRVLLTRDGKLIGQARKMGIESIRIASSDLHGQMVELLRSMGVRRTELDPSRSRCPVCNGDLRMVSGSQVAQEVPAKVLSYHSHFWKCSACGKVYWMGRHWENMKEKINDVNALLDVDSDADEARHGARRIPGSNS